MRSVACALAISSLTLTGCGSLGPDLSGWVSDAAAADFGKDGLKRYLNLDYTGAGAGPDQRLDLYVPDGTNLPLLIWIHGGAWITGDKEVCPLLVMTRGGYAVASINYRLSKVAPYPAQIDDVRAAINYLKDNAARYGIDKNRIGLCGFSAGAHLAALAGTTGGLVLSQGAKGKTVRSPQVQAVSAWAGVYDLVSISGQKQPDSQLAFEGPDSVVYKLFAGKDDRQHRATASPSTYVSADDPPFFIVHGGSDKMVPPVQTDQFAKALKNKGVAVECRTPADSSHEFGMPEEARGMVDFFERYVKNAPHKVPAGGDSKP